MTAPNFADDVARPRSTSADWIRHVIMRSLILCLALAASPASGFLALDLPPRHPLFDFPLRSLALGPHASLSTLPVSPLASTFSALLANTPSTPHWRVGERGLEIDLDLLVGRVGVGRYKRARSTMRSSELDGLHWPLLRASP